MKIRPPAANRRPFWRPHVLLQIITGDAIMSDPVVRGHPGSGRCSAHEADQAMAAIKERGASAKPEVLQRFNCVVGVQDASFEVARGEIFCIMGLSGSGKSTLVRHINRLIEPTAGTIEVLGRDVGSMPEPEAICAHVRTETIGMVFQHMALMPHRSVRDNVAYPLEIREASRSPSAGRSRTTPWHWWTWWATRTVCRRNCPAACSSASALPGRWRPIRKFAYGRTLLRAGSPDPDAASGSVQGPGGPASEDHAFHHP